MVPQEDLELENEELSSKLTDLTTQAKKMLLNNEALEEAIQDQRIEYEDRIAELEVEKYGDDEVSSLHSKHKTALETIARLKQEKNAYDVDKVKCAEEENLELRRVVDHLSSENNAAKEIESIVFELKVKNKEISESLRVSQEQNLSAVDIIENLKTMARQGDISIARLMLKAEAHNDRALPVENESGERESELHRYKSISNMTSDMNVLNNRLSEVSYNSMPSELALDKASSASESALPASANERSLILLASKNAQDPPDNETIDHGMMVVATDNVEACSYALNSYDPPPAKVHRPVNGIEEQMQNLTNEQSLIPFESKIDQDPLDNKAMNNGMLVVATDNVEACSYALNSYEPPPTKGHHPVDRTDDQIQHLTNENGQLAQRLGNAVAEKECEI